MSRGTTQQPIFSRREALELFVLAASLAMTAGCSDAALPKVSREGARQTPDSELDEDATFEDNVDAAFESILPAERDASGKVIVPGAREAGAGRVLSEQGFGLFALAVGFVPTLPPRIVSLLEDAGDAFRDAVNVELDLLAAARRPLTAFRDLDPALREEVVAAAFDDDGVRPSMLLVRAACFTAYLGAVTSDVGLRAVGFPAFENWDDGIAVSGYPRKTTTGAVDDYTYARDPDPTAGDDLTAVVDAAGDLV